MPNFSIPLTGLQADTTALNVIGNNLANLNTTAFKGQTTSFEDLFYQTIGTTGSGNSLQVGVGTRVAGTSSDFGQGSLTTTSTNTDMALSGSGFFLVQNGNVQSLTRAGDFQISAGGDLITSTGENVMGYGAVNGAVNLNGGVIPITLPITATEGAQATQNLSMTTSLDASAPVGQVYTAQAKIYDSLGTSHIATVTYTKQSASSWNYNVSIPSTDYAAGGASANSSGTLTFGPNGNLLTPTGNISGVTFSGMADGANNLSFNFDLYSNATPAVPLVTQTTGTSNTSATSQDGFSSGAYQGFSINQEGVISASFSNGNSAVVGQVAVALVSNNDGLTRSGANDYSVTSASGELTVGTGGVGGRGILEGESLEQSNVDISAEFSDLIVAQRAFEANSKAVTTFDSVTQDAIGMIR
jgi:flagellar hook protein FlgE